MSKLPDPEVKTLEARPDTVIYEFSSKNPPVMRACPGDVVIFETLDCRRADPNEHDRYESVGLGPDQPTRASLQEGAEVGDTLAVT